ncbi:hypothetical protein D0862_06292 [Hortaea werneckii]|uniref:C2H2-type domain-containing protein n=1 Tax=Hortaea werneckii TaxID=91943 RepID=A0A3M7GK79_HORWE|nr:hypothetical protein D0862_06292 [Hortaea werneckii]
MGSIQDTLNPDSGLLQSPASPIHDAAGAGLCPSNLTALTGGAFPTETTPREPTEPLPGVVPAPQPPPSEREGYFAPIDDCRYADNQTPGRVPKWVTDDLLKRCSTTEGDLHKCIHQTHEEPHEFPKLRDLKKHLRNHIPYEHLPHHCVENGCGRRFLFLKDLKRHRKTHAGSSVECPVCNENSSRFDNLARHIRTQHPDIPIAEVMEGLSESLGEGLMLPEPLSAAHDGKALKSMRSKKPRTGTPDDMFAGEAMDDESNIDPMLRAAQHPANDATARVSSASASSHTDTLSATGVTPSARSTEDNRKRLRRRESKSSISDLEQSQSTPSTRSTKSRKIRCATLTAPSSAGSGSSERK